MVYINDDASNDINRLDQALTSVTQGSVLYKILKEVDQARRIVSRYVFQNQPDQPMPLMAHAKAIYDKRTHFPRYYVVTYGENNLGNFVHELTHVSINERLKRDFFNIPVNLSKQQRNAMPMPKYAHDGSLKNEEARQLAWFRHANIGGCSDTLRRLRELVNASHLKHGQKQQVSAQLSYGEKLPHLETHTVVNQVLVWVWEWGYFNKKTGKHTSTFLNGLNRAADDFWRIRMQNFSPYRLGIPDTTDTDTSSDTSSSDSS